jgi:hypothetical protein
VAINTSPVYGQFNKVKQLSISGNTTVDVFALLGRPAKAVEFKWQDTNPHREVNISFNTVIRVSKPHEDRCDELVQIQNTKGDCITNYNIDNGATTSPAANAPYAGPVGRVIPFDRFPVEHLVFSSFSSPGGAGSSLQVFLYY